MAVAAIVIFAGVVLPSGAAAYQDPLPVVPDDEEVAEDFDEPTVTAEELPSTWPPVIREIVANRQRSDGVDWRTQIDAHESQQRTKGWKKFETYTLYRDRDLLGVPTFAQMEAADRAGNRLTVRLARGEDPTTLARYGLRHLKQLGSGLLANTHSFAIPFGSDFAELLDRVNADSAVVYAEPDYAAELMAMPNDEYVASLDAVLDLINAPEAWDVTTDATGIGPIAIFDDGISEVHPDLSNNMWVNPDETADNGLDDDNNGYVDDVNGVLFGRVPNVPNAFDWHGTQVAGSLCPAGDNGIGVVGVAWSCNMMDLTVWFATDPVISEFPNAIAYAIAEGSRLSNHSWGVREFSQTMADTVAAADEAGHLLVIAAGNDGVDNDTAAGEDLLYPQALQDPNIVTVGATDELGDRATYSNFGQVSVDLAAPAEFLTTSRDGNYRVFDGTSQSTPVVTGAVALAWSLDPMLSHHDIKNALIASTSPNPTWAGQSVSGGVLDIEALVLAVSGAAVIPGDVSADGVLDDSDVRAVLGWLVGGPEPAALTSGDINSDGAVNLADALAIAQLASA